MRSRTERLGRPYVVPYLWRAGQVATRPPSIWLVDCTASDLLKPGDITKTFSHARLVSRSRKALSATCVAGRAPSRLHIPGATHIEGFQRLLPWLLETLRRTLNAHRHTLHAFVESSASMRVTNE